MEWIEFDPFKELGVDRSASLQDVKKAYRGLTMQHHPDRGGDPKRFMRIAKAYAALTNDDARKKWEEFGNPEGPGATQFGIALPKWIIEKKNSLWVLGIYLFIFMFLLPVGVGTWWYRSIKYGGEEVLLNTIRLYYYVFRNSPNIILQRGIVILCGSLEFEKSNNPEIQERPSDNFELPQLLKQLPNFNIKSKEKPFCYPYSVKARIIVHSHLYRLELPPNSLELDRRYIVKKCPYLINQMINMISYIVCIGSNSQQHHVPPLESMENIMRLSPMVVQALWDKQSSLLQLPHITEDMLRHFVTRKRNIKTVRQLVEMPEEERTALLRTLSYEQYRDVMIVACGMPSVQMVLEMAVIDDDDQTITAGSYVTVTARLTRQNMGVFRPSQGTSSTSVQPSASSPDTFALCPTPTSTQPVTWEGEADDEEDGGNRLPNGSAATAAEEDKNGAAANAASTPKRSRPWQKNRNQKKKSAGGGAKQTHKKKVQQQNTKTAANAAPIKDEKREEGDEEDKQSCSGDEAQGVSGSEDSDQGNNRSSPREKRRPRRAPAEGDEKEERDSDNEEGWQRFQADVRKENSLETKEHTKHVVHCPFFPGEKLEFWWIYIADKRSKTLITAPQQIRSLQDTEEILLKFPAPMVPGQYVFTVCLRSDSYLQLDVFQNIKLDVLEARQVEHHPQWNISSDEDDDMCRLGSGSDDEKNYSDDSDYDYSD